VGGAVKSVLSLLLFLLLPVQAKVSFEDLLKPPAEDWLTYSGDFTGRRFSLLRQITTENASQLVPQWVFHIPESKRLMVTPVVVDGVMYVTNSNEVYALDARTGRSLWQFKFARAKKSEPNRGVAVLEHRVFFVTSDAHLIALHAKTGAVLWDTVYADHEKRYSATLAPLAINGKVIVGVSGGDLGVRGYLDAYAAATGKQLWRFWTVPGPDEPGSETWGGQPAEYSGAGTWMTGTYDPEQNLLFWGTGNPGPDFYGVSRPGDNLYSDCVVAVDADTGKLKWYFQFTPHDTHDWDAAEMPVLIDTIFEGRPRKLLVQANRNGFFYVLDRINGKLLRATPLVKKLNWARRILPDGRPDVIPDMEPTPAGKPACPGVVGATNFFSPSFNRDTGLFYVMTLEECDLYVSSARPFSKNEDYSGTAADPIPSEPGQFVLRAIDIQNGKARWEIPMAGFDPAAWPGTLSSAGGVVFFADDSGYLSAADAQTGKLLWHFYTGQVITASPMTYMAGGKQYVALAAGADIFSFALFNPEPRSPASLIERSED
jgi:alcohol dehydrogenase (cytochrome c)